MDQSFFVTVSKFLNEISRILEISFKNFEDPRDFI